MTETSGYFLCYLLLITASFSSLTAKADPLVIVTEVLPPVTVGRFYETILSAAGGQPPYQWGLARQESVPYPNGFSFLSNGTLSGTATFASRYPPRIQVMDSQGTIAIQSFSLVVFPAPILAINSGGLAEERFDKDNSAGSIEGGSAGLTYSVTNNIDLTGVLNPAPEAVYQTERYGNPNLIYTIAGLQTSLQPRLTVGITYLIRLHFAEIRPIQQGERQFNITINGQRVLTNFDIVAESGSLNKAIVKEFTATATTIRGSRIGAITLVMNAGSYGVPKISGIEILPATLFITQTPVVLGATDGRSYELGTKFSTTVPGLIVALRFWRSSRETSPNTGHLWARDGSLLAQVNFAAQTNSGWQEAALSTPVEINDNVLYVVSVSIQNYFVNTVEGLQYPGILNGYLQATSADINRNGVFGDIGTFPTLSYEDSNYFCDVVFTAQF